MQFLSRAYDGEGKLRRNHNNPIGDDVVYSRRKQRRNNGSHQIGEPSSRQVHGNKPCRLDNSRALSQLYRDDYWQANRSAGKAAA